MQTRRAAWWAVETTVSFVLTAVLKEVFRAWRAVETTVSFVLNAAQKEVFRVMILFAELVSDIQ
ncbi:hypothetical protein T484DRAFT_1864215, partial [Baffinella frigidus]